MQNFYNITLHKSAAVRLFGCLALVLPLCACNSVDPAKMSDSAPDDYRLRHPIVLTDRAQHLDIYASDASGRIDARQSADIDAFAALYLGSGKGRISVQVPGKGDQPPVQATLRTIKSRLAAAGVRGSFSISGYVADEAGLTAPIRLSFEHLSAKVVSRCGQWPADLAGLDGDGLQNRPYYNLGCATQTALAAQVADPVDLVRPRQEDPADVQMRTRAISAVRSGKDPSTFWFNTNTNIGNLGN